MAWLVDRRNRRRQGLAPCLFLLGALTGLPLPSPAASVWTETPSPSKEVLRALAFYNRADGFAVGNAGTMLRFVKGAWQNFPSGSDQHLYDVAVVNSGEAWAVGETGTILSYRPSAVAVVQTLPLPLGGDARCVRTCDQMAVPLSTVDFLMPAYSTYAAGSFAVTVSPSSVLCEQTISTGAGGPTCFPPPQDMTTGTWPCGDWTFWLNHMNVTVSPANGTGTSRCSTVPGSFPPGSTSATHAPAWASIAWAQYQDPNLVFTPGEPPNGTPGPLVIRVGVADAFEGTTVTLRYAYNPAKGWKPDPQSQQLTLLPLHAVSFLNASNGWACGGNPLQGGIVLHYDGASWVTATRTIDALYGLAAVGSDNIWFCGDQHRIMKFDGSEFTRVNISGPVTGPGAWRDIVFPFKSIGWVVGDAGKIMRYSSSNPPSDPFTEFLQGSALAPASTLFAISMLQDSGRGYVVGQNGVRLAFDGSVFTAEASGGEDLRAVALMNELEGAAVGGASAGRIVALRGITTETGTVNVRLFPNPVDPGRGETLTIDKLPNDVTALGIYTLRGELVDDLTHTVTYEPVTGIARWKGRIHDGRLAASGTYLLRISTKRGAKGKGLFLVARK